MPSPTSTTDLLDRLRRSGLIPATDLTVFLSDIDPHSISPKELLGRLVTARLLTPFQADRLGAGKYKGFVLGTYIILDKLGGGGMGQVFLAEHAAMRRLVALKVLPGHVAEDPVARERFHREARAAAALDHPNIVRVFDLNREGKLLYLVMEYVEGLTLQGLIQQGGAISIGAAADYARQVADGLQHAHLAGMVHRDVKPGNLLVDRAGVVKILDLGLVRSAEDADSKLTSQLGMNSILGTADYLAPEQAVDSSAVDIRADVYGLGATLYYLLAGRPLFPEGKTAQKLMWQQWREPEPLHEVRPEVPAELSAVVHKALAKRREDRFQTPGELGEALAPWAVLTPPNPEWIPLPPPRRWTPRSTEDTGTSSVRMRGSSHRASAISDRNRSPNLTSSDTWPERNPTSETAGNRSDRTSPQSIPETATTEEISHLGRHRSSRTLAIVLGITALVIILGSVVAFSLGLFS